MIYANFWKGVVESLSYYIDSFKYRQKILKILLFNICIPITPKVRTV